MRKDWNAAEHETDFVSLTDDTINKQLEEVKLGLFRKLKRTQRRTSLKLLRLEGLNSLL